MKPVSRGIDRVCVTFDDPNLMANAGLLLVATLVRRLGLEALCNATIGLTGRNDFQSIDRPRTLGYANLSDLLGKDDGLGSGSVRWTD